MFHILYYSRIDSDYRSRSAPSGFVHVRNFLRALQLQYRVESREWRTREDCCTLTRLRARISRSHCGYIRAKRCCCDNCNVFFTSSGSRSRCVTREQKSRGPLTSCSVQRNNAARRALHRFVSYCYLVIGTRWLLEATRDSFSPHSPLVASSPRVITRDRVISDQRSRRRDPRKANPAVARGP